MSGFRSGRRAFLGGLILLAALPFALRFLRGPLPPACTADGVALEGGPVVEMGSAEGPALRFCCVGCAERWILATGGEFDRILVTDEITGERIPARDAWFVRSMVPSRPETRDRVHAFATREDALRHAEAYRGDLLKGDERPFHGPTDHADSPR